MKGKKMKTKITTRLTAMILAVFSIIGILPITPFTITANAASYPNSRNVPAEMLDNKYLDALAYLGWNLDTLRDGDHLYQHGWHSSALKKNHPDIMSDVPYGGSANGLEVKSDGTPDVQAIIDKGGFQCADFVTYVLLNYLTNVRHEDYGWLKDKVGNTRSPGAWLSALRELSKKGDGKVEMIYDLVPDYSLIPDIKSFWSTGVTTDKYIDYSRLQMGDIIIFASESNSAIHMGIYIGTCDDGNGKAWTNCHFMIDNSFSGPNVMLIEYMLTEGRNRQFLPLYSV